MTKGYIFDYGGTLDTGGCHWGKVLWHSYERCRVPVTEAQFREAYVQTERALAGRLIIGRDFTFRMTLATKVRMQMEFLSQQVGSGLLSLAGEVVDDLYARTVAQTAHSREVLLRLRQRFPLVLVTNFYGNMPVVLQEFGFGGLFLSVIESSVVGIRKPDPRLFRMGVEALDLPPADVTVVGDSIDKDIIPSKEIGCTTVWYKGEGWTDTPVDESLPDRVIHDLAELL